MQPDAYFTWEALVALAEAGGVAVTDPAWQKGLHYLLSTREADGSWHVHTRMLSPGAVSPPSVEFGFPYGHDKFISTDATCWAAMALMLTLPKVAKPPTPPPPAVLTRPPISGRGLMLTPLHRNPGTIEATHRLATLAYSTHARTPIVGRTGLRKARWCRQDSVSKC